MFLKTKVEVGRVKQGSSVIVNFPYDDETVEVRSMESSCGCGLPYNNIYEKKVWVNYTANTIDHLPDQSIRTEKTVSVVYINKQGLAVTEVLTFTATIYKKF